MYSYTLTFKEDVGHQVMFVTHRAHYSSLYLDKGVRVPQS